MQPTIAIVEKKENKALHKWVAKETSGRVLRATTSTIDLVLSQGGERRSR